VYHVKIHHHQPKVHHNLQQKIRLRLLHVMMILSQLKVPVVKILKAFMKGKSRIKMENIIILIGMDTQCSMSMMVSSRIIGLFSRQITNISM